jgi:hypothetical protein
VLAEDRKPRGRTPGTRVGNGAGWGGPAKGASTSRIRKGDPDGIQAMSNDPDIKARNAKRNAELKDHLYDLALHAEKQETQLAAANAWLNRDEGQPVARSINATVDDLSKLTDAELDAKLRAELAAAGVATPSGEEAQAPSREPGGVVH